MLILLAVHVLMTPSLVVAENDDSVFPLVKGEQRRVRYRDPAALPDVFIEATAPPPTVTAPLPENADLPVPLDEALRMALANSEVVRQLAGTIATSSGRTIYDLAIANTVIDQQRAVFDPVVNADNAWTQTEQPFVDFNPGDPSLARFGGVKAENHRFSLDVSQRNLAGGLSRLGFSNDALLRSPGLFPLNRQNSYGTEVSYTQPLLRGAGIAANRTPIVLSRIDTERSFFQFRDSIQELIRGTIEAYWSVVFARTDVWARGIQVLQAEELVRFSEARLRANVADVTVLAQARSALAQFRASQITSEANLLAREAALQNILGIPPTQQQRLMPTTPPTSERIDFNWNEITQVAQQRRPDIIELKLILEADQQRLILANNDVQPNLDFVAAYRWNGLEGRMPNGARTGTVGDAATDWSLGVNFSVPLFLRQERAALRSAQLLVARDRANLRQGIHNAQHILALNFRNLDTFYAQYEAFRDAREAARQNLERQYAANRQGFDVLFVNVLQAISDWGNSVSQEAQALAQYNIELANIERQTGTILETHGIYFFEDRFCSLGPLWVSSKHDKPYPRSIRPTDNEMRYEAGDEPSENFFDLENYPRRLPPSGPGPYRDLPPSEPRALPPVETLPPAEPQPPPAETTPRADLSFPSSVAGGR